MAGPQGRGSWHSWAQVRGGLRRIQSLWQGTPAAVSQDPRLLSPGDHSGPPLCLTVTRQWPAWEYSGSPRSLLLLPPPSPLESEFCFLSLDGPRVPDAMWGVHSQGATEPARAAAPWHPPPALCPAQAYPSSSRSARPALGDPAQKRAGRWDSWIDPTAQPVLSNQKNAARHPVHSS